MIVSKTLNDEALKLLNSIVLLNKPVIFTKAIFSGIDIYGHDKYIKGSIPSLRLHDDVIMATISYSNRTLNRPVNVHTVDIFINHPTKEEPEDLLLYTIKYEPTFKIESPLDTGIVSKELTVLIDISLKSISITNNVDDNDIVTRSVMNAEIDKINSKIATVKYTQIGSTVVNTNLSDITIAGKFTSSDSNNIFEELPTYFGRLFKGEVEIIGDTLYKCTLLDTNGIALTALRSKEDKYTFSQEIKEFDKISGIIQDDSLKEKGKKYFDIVNKKTYMCCRTTDSNINSNDFFNDITQDGIYKKIYNIEIEYTHVYDKFGTLLHKNIPYPKEIVATNKTAYPYDQNSMIISTILYKYPIIEEGVIREKTVKELKLDRILPLDKGEFIQDGELRFKAYDPSLNYFTPEWDYGKNEYYDAMSYSEQVKNYGAMLIKYSHEISFGGFYYYHKGTKYKQACETQDIIMLMGQLMAIVVSNYVFQVPYDIKWKFTGSTPINMTPTEFYTFGFYGMSFVNAVYAAVAEFSALPPNAGLTRKQVIDRVNSLGLDILPKIECVLEN